MISSSSSSSASAAARSLFEEDDLRLDIAPEAEPAFEEVTDALPLEMEVPAPALLARAAEAEIGALGLLSLATLDLPEGFSEEDGVLRT